MNSEICRHRKTNPDRNPGLGLSSTFSATLQKKMYKDQVIYQNQAQIQKATWNVTFSEPKKKKRHCHGSRKICQSLSQPEGTPTETAMRHLEISFCFNF